MKKENWLVVIDGKLCRRVPYGNDYPDWHRSEYKSKCHDCSVNLDQFHVEGCDVERCPNCGGQLISCRCEDVTWRDGTPVGLRGLLLGDWGDQGPWIGEAE